MRLLNQRYMAAATSFQSLHHLINRLQRRGRDAAARALIAAYRPIGEALSLPPQEQHDPVVLTRRLRVCADSLPAHVAALRERCDEPAGRLEFDTGAALVQRLADELADFTAVEASLRAGNLRGSVERVHFRRGNDLAGAAVATLRTFLTMLVLAAFWLASGWAFGGSAMLLATIFSGLLAASPNPIGAATRTLYGYAGGMAAGFVAVFVLLPGSDGFAMLICATAGLLLIGPYLATRDTLPGVGAGYTLGFVYILALKNPMAYDPTHFLNDAIAQVAGLLLSGMAFMVMPGVTGTQWQRSRQLRLLREQVTLAASAPLTGLAWRFESVSRDLLQQVVAHTRPDSEESRHLLAWSLAVQESGRAVIELRQDLSGNELPADARDAAMAALEAVAALYRQPAAARWQAADAAVLAAIHAAPRGATARRHLYQLRSALRDDQSPLGAYMPLPEAAHAA
jgi:uncharacterized membrane protein YccC